MSSRHTATGISIALTGGVLSALLMPACDRDTPASGEAASAIQGPSLSLRETYDQLRQWRNQRRYLAMRPHIDPASRDNVIDLLIALDELLAANAGAQRAIEQACPNIPAGRFDLAAQLEDNLDLFSKHAEFVGQQENDDRGTVTIQIADRLPLTRVDFQRRDGHWIYVPGPVGRDLIPVIRDIAGALNRIRLVVSTGPLTEAQIEAEYRLRIGRKLRRIGELAAAAEEK